MKIAKKIIMVVVCTFAFSVLFFTSCIFATEIPEDYEYIATVGPGESYSTYGVILGVYQVSATSLGSTSGWCPSCSSGARHTYSSGSAVSSTYRITVDGANVLEYCSTSAGTGTIDLSIYTNSNSTITLPANYNVTRRESCTGGNYSGGGSISSCGYSSSTTITVTGNLRLFGKSKKPKITAQPVSVSSGTDQGAKMSVSGENIVGYQWQKRVGDDFVNLSNGADGTGIVYSGVNSGELNISGARLSDDGSRYRCVLTGEFGDTVVTDECVLHVTDVSAPRISLSFSPAGDTYGNVTISIQAVDIDSGLDATPYYYQGIWSKEPSFSVSGNGTYEVSVKDAVGNVGTSSICISNIKEKREDPPGNSSSNNSSGTTSNSNPSGTAPVIVYPTPVITPTESTGRSSSSGSSGNRSSSDNASGNVKNTDKDNAAGKQTSADTTAANLANAGKVNIGGLTNEGNDIVNRNRYTGYDDGSLGGNESMEPETDTEEVDSDEKFSMIDETELMREELKKRERQLIMNMVFGLIGILAIIVAVLFTSFFVVKIDTADELKTWHFCCVKILLYRREWQIVLGEMLEDFDSLRIRFGGLFVSLSQGKSVHILLGESEDMILSDIQRDMVIHYKDVRRIL